MKKFLCGYLIPMLLYGTVAWLILPLGLMTYFKVLVLVMIGSKFQDYGYTLPWHK